MLSLPYLCLIHNCQWVRPKWYNYCNVAMFWPAMAHSSWELLLSLDEIWQCDMEAANRSLALFLAGFFIDKMSDYGTGFLMAGVALLVSAMFLLLLHQMNLRAQGSTTKQHMHTDPTGQNSQEVKELDMTRGEENDFCSNRWWVHREIWIMKTEARFYLWRNVKFKGTETVLWTIIWRISSGISWAFRSQLVRFSRLVGLSVREWQSACYQGIMRLIKRFKHS